MGSQQKRSGMLYKTMNQTTFPEIVYQHGLPTIWRFWLQVHITVGFHDAFSLYFFPMIQSSMLWFHLSPKKKKWTVFRFFFCCFPVQNYSLPSFFFNHRGKIYGRLWRLHVLFLVRELEKDQMKKSQVAFHKYIIKISYLATNSIYPSIYLFT